MVSPDRGKFVVKIDEIPEDEEITSSVFTADLAQSSFANSQVDEDEGLPSQLTEEQNDLAELP